jgi:hypothetical protein
MTNRFEQRSQSNFFRNLEIITASTIAADEGSKISDDVGAVESRGTLISWQLTRNGRFARFLL